MTPPKPGTEGETKEVFEFKDQSGLQYYLALGTNDEGRRVIFLLMKAIDAKIWHPVIEMDIDVDSYFKDTDSKLDPPGTKDGD